MAMTSSSALAAPIRFSAARKTISSREGAGADTLDGGIEGGSLFVADIVSYVSSPAAKSVTLGNNGAETIGQGGHAQGDRISNIETIFGSEFNDVLNREQSQ